MSGVGKMNGTAITNWLQNSFKIKDNNLYGHCIIEILGIRPSNRLPLSYYLLGKCGVDVFSFTLVKRV